MGTNYYAEMTIGRELSNKAILQLHIGKQSGPGGIGIFCGKYFPDVKSWINFLQFNQDCIIIKNEYNEEIDFEDFLVKHIIGDGSSASSHTIQWLEDNNYIINPEPEPEAWKEWYWIDKDSGRLFYSGDFS